MDDLGSKIGTIIILSIVLPPLIPVFMVAWILHGVFGIFDNDKGDSDGE